MLARLKNRRPFELSWLSRDLSKESQRDTGLARSFPADFKSAQEFVDGLRKLNPRLYSIASSTKGASGRQF